MGGGGGERTVVQGTQQAPQIAPEAKKGFEQAQTYYQGVLAEPPIFSGQRLAPVTGTQQQALEASKATFGDTTTSGAASSQLQRTLEGGYLYGPEAQAAIDSLAAPIFSRYFSEIAPGVRDRAQFAGQGITGSRRGIAEEQALESLGTELGRSVVAPIFASERANQMAALEALPEVIGSDVIRLGQLAGAGAQERAFSQEELDLAQQIFEEPIFRQSQAAQALLGAAQYGPGASGGTTRATQTLSTGQEIGQWVQILGTIAMIGSMFASDRNLKTDFERVNPDEVAMIMLTMPVSQWRYKIDPVGIKRIGPMIQDMPEWMKWDTKTPHLLSYIGALLVTVQQMNKRLEVLENALQATGK